MTTSGPESVPMKRRSFAWARISSVSSLDMAACGDDGSRTRGAAPNVKHRAAEVSSVLNALGGVLAVVICVGLNAFFVAAEFALVTVRRTWVEEQVAAGTRGAKNVHAAIGKLDDTIA